MSDERLSPRQAAAYIEKEWHLKVHPETVRRWVRRGALPATRTPSGYVVIEPAALRTVFASWSTETIGND